MIWNLLMAKGKKKYKCKVGMKPKLILVFSFSLLGWLWACRGVTDTSISLFCHRLLSPLTMDEFAWTKKQAVLYVNLFFAGLSFLTISTLFAVKYITRKWAIIVQWLGVWGGGGLNFDLVIGISGIGVTSFFFFHRVDERVVLMIGMFLLAFAFFALIPMGTDPPKKITMSCKIPCPVRQRDLLKYTYQ